MFFDVHGFRSGQRSQRLTAPMLSLRAVEAVYGSGDAMRKDMNLARAF